MRIRRDWTTQVPGCACVRRSWFLPDRAPRPTRMYPASPDNNPPRVRNRAKDLEPLANHRERRSRTRAGPAPRVEAVSRYGPVIVMNAPPNPSKVCVFCLRGFAHRSVLELPGLAGERNGGKSRGHLQLRQDVMDMLLDRPRADRQPLGDVGIPKPPRELRQDLSLTIR